jgi:hypothetical protein
MTCRETLSLKYVGRKIKREEGGDREGWVCVGGEEG